MFTKAEPLIFDHFRQNFRFHFKTVTIKLVLLIAVSCSGQAFGDNLVIFNQDPPSAEELGNLLFPESDPNKPKTRSIETDLSPNPKTRSIVITQPSTKTDGNSESQQESFGLLIKFAFDSSEILPDSIPYLGEVAKMLNLERLEDEKILIEGHADARGETGHNLVLSEKRAKAVMEYLVQNHNIAPFRIRTVGKGEMQLLSDRHPFDPLNRRVQFYRVQ